MNNATGKAIKIATRIVSSVSLCLVLAGSLSGCLVADHPVTVAKYSDPSVLGSWVCTGDENGPRHMKLEVSEGKDGLYHVDQTEDPLQSEVGAAAAQPRTESFEVFLSKGLKYTFANQVYKTPVEKKEQVIDANTKMQTQYIIYQYETSADQLTVRSMGYNELAAAINSGKLHGKAWETTWGSNALITDDSQKLLEFLEKPEGRAVFTHKLVFVRSPSGTPTQTK